MALIHENVTVGTTHTLLVEVQTGSRQNIPVYFQNLDTAAIFIGDSAITATGATQGQKIAAGASLQLWLNGGDRVFGISAAGTGAGLVVVQYSA